MTDAIDKWEYDVCRSCVYMCVPIAVQADEKVHLSDFLFSHLLPDSHGHLLLGNFCYLLSFMEIMLLVLMLLPSFQQSIQPPV